MREVLSLFTFAIGALCFVVFMTQSSRTLRKCGPARLTLWTLPARSEVVPILIVQTSDLLAPISKSTTRT